ncbi:MAG: protein-L-isoaspartate(D-aspartate) O-methyltransferase [Vicinamibacterales bacterium]
MTAGSWLRVWTVALLVWPACRPASGDAARQVPAAAPGREAEAARLVEQLRASGIADARVLAALRAVPRHRFVPADQQAAAYENRPLPIGFGQTISQPYIVAFMTEALALTPSDVVLEIGTGSGYQAAILGEIAREVYTIELLPELAERARRTLEAQGYRNVHVRAGDGYQGWPEHAPFPKVIVTAAPDQVPQALVDQLAVGGTMVVPVGPRDGAQELRILRKTERGVVTERSLPVRFVPMVKKPPA